VVMALDRAGNPRCRSAIERATDWILGMQSRSGGWGAFDAENVTVTVDEMNLAPVLKLVGNQNIDEGMAFQFNATASDADIPENSLVFTCDGCSDIGATVNPTTGVFSWTPDESQGPGNYTVTISVSDGSLTDEESVTIIVMEVNRSPVLAPIGEMSIDEETILTFKANATDPDIPSNSLTFTLGNGAPAGAVMTPDGIFSWTPTEDQGPGVFLVTIIVSDGELASSGTVEITVREVNSSPILAVPDSPRLAFTGATLVFTVNATDRDIPANTITLSCLNCASIGASFDPSAGTFSFTASPDQNGQVYLITFNATDGGAPSLSDTRTVEIRVVSNAAPVLASLGDKTTDEETLLTFTADASDPEGQELTFSLSSAPQGAIIDPATGVFTWTPTESQGPGNYTMEVVVTDSLGSSDSETITVTVNEVNNAPVLSQIGDKTVDEGNTLSFTASATDLDFPYQPLTFSLSPAAPLGASISPAGVFAWTPSEAQGPSPEGSYAVTVIVTDGSATDSETILILVEELNQQPSLTVPGPQATTETISLTFSVTASDSDIPANTISLSASGLPPGSTFNSTTGIFGWTPTQGQAGTYNVTFTATDNGTPPLSDSRPVSITVHPAQTLIFTPTDDAFIRSDQPQNNFGSATTIQVDALPVKHILLKFSVSAPNCGSVVSAKLRLFVVDRSSRGGDFFATIGNSWNESGVNWNNAPSAGTALASVGTVTSGTWVELDLTSHVTCDSVLSLRVSSTSNNGADYSSKEGTNAPQLVVVVANQAPTLDSISDMSIDEGSLLTFTASATDAEGDPLIFSLGPGAPVGASITTNGVFSWTPTEEQGPGTYTVTIMVSDGYLSDSSTITITVNEIQP